ncbi:MAG: electron transfer flavoprotein subunit beta/FixA family protein [Desulfobacterales bacterium]|nr:electron transfer flavoprotein subunit beta/FixA family protein [Desulfobacterales bacterium]
MKILVCIKPDVSGEEIGPFENLALEAGLCLKEDCSLAGMENCRVDAVTAGPSAWADCIHRALGMGADKGIHILTEPSEDDGGLTPASLTAGRLGAFVSSAEIPYDLILTGVMSQDLMAGQTGPMLAAHLDMACATAVVRTEIRDNILVARREWEEGYRETLEVELPALVSVQAGFYIPRYPTLSHMLKAKSKPVVAVNGEDLGSRSSGERFSGLTAPAQLREGKIIRGSIEDQVLAFKTFLKQRALV